MASHFWSVNVIGNISDPRSALPSDPITLPLNPAFGVELVSLPYHWNVGYQLSPAHLRQTAGYLDKEVGFRPSQWPTPLLPELPYCSLHEVR